MMPFAVLGLLLAAAALAVRFTAFSGDRIRSIRWRIRLRMHPGPGFASIAELWFRWSRHAAISHGRRARPGLRLRHRLRSRTTDYAVRLGRGQWFRRAYARMEDQVLVMAAQRTGKALALDTPVPVPGGWTTMGALQDGDLVFGADGQPCRVAQAWPVRHGRPCYEVTFSDGSVITADSDHLWLVHTFESRRSERRQKLYRHDTPGRSQQHKRKLPQVLSTADMASSVRIPYGYSNYSVCLGGPLFLPDADLPVPPYTLGAWLGDGTAKSSDITSVDPEIIKEIESEGETCIQSQAPYAERCPVYLVAGLRRRLRAIGVLQNKHIPASYLRASEAQRRALLAGLLDTDGSCDKSNNVEFYATNERLARDVRHLFATLGYKSRLRSKPARLNGKDCGTCWVVTASPAEPVFRLPRKLERHAPGRNTRKDLYITAIRSVDSVPVRCITVDSPDHLYLVGETCIPTHNSGIVADRILDHPGPVLATSTRADLYESTAGARALRGPVHVFNPQDVGGVPSSLAWDLLGPCKDLVMARRMASWLKVSDIGGDLSWFQQKGDVALMSFLWAAAVTGRTILDVYEWVQLHGHAVCLEILASHPGSSRQMFAVCKRMFEENRTSGSIRDTIDLTLSWAILPGLAAAVTPLPGEGFSAADFTTSCGTLYMIAGGDDDSPITPLFKALAQWVHFEAGMAGSKGPHKRLDPPLLMALDEVTQVCPVDLPVMLGDSAGKGVLIEAVCHSKSQLEQRWGKHGADTVWACSGTKVLLGAISDPDTLDAASKLCGNATTGDGKEPVVPPELLRMLPDWRALIIRMNLSPVVVKVRPAWRRLAYRLGRHPLPAPRLYPAGDLAAAWASLPLPEPPRTPASANGHGGKPGPLAKVGTDE